MRSNPARLQELQRLAILETEPEVIYDDLARLLAKGLGVPITMVNFLDRNRDWFKACVGLPLRESPADTSFCAVFLERPELDTIVVEDTTLDPHFSTHPLVVGAPFIRFYAAARIVSHGQTVGTLCAYDTRPRTLDAKQLAQLQTLASAAIEMLARRRPVESGDSTSAQR